MISHIRNLVFFVFFGQGLKVDSQDFFSFSRRVVSNSVWSSWSVDIGWRWTTKEILNGEVNYLNWCIPASSKWLFDSPNGGHLSSEKVTYGSKRGHFEEPGNNRYTVIYTCFSVYRIWWFTMMFLWNAFLISCLFDVNVWWVDGEQADDVLFRMHQYFSPEITCGTC